MILRFKNIVLFFALLLSTLSCSDSLEFSASGETYISVEGINLRSHLGDHVGDDADYIVNSLRILVFDKTGAIKGNTYYNAHNKEIIRFPIKIGTYDLVFIANEPSLVNIKTILDNVTAYSDLDNIAFPAASFSSTQIIPMVQAIRNVEVLSNGAGVKIGGGTTESKITLALNRMAARLDIDLKAEDDLIGAFQGINLSGIPNIVPLFPQTYTGAAVTRNVSRAYTLADDPTYFSNTSPPSGSKWAIKASRIIIPSNDFLNKSESDKAITLTVNLEDKYSPFCKLQIEDSPSANYTLPHNTKLDINGTIKMPLDLNIIAKPWTEKDEDWEISTRKLNISAIKANITDFNGVRISFSTNLPKVRVLPTVVDLSNSSKETNLIFNDLAETVDNQNPSRFFFDKNTGSGYMDILVDGGKSDGSLNQPGSSTYKLTLLAEDADGKRSVQRDITINISQYGTRPGYDPWGKGYAGAFYRNEEIGERIISGQHLIGQEWSAKVLSVNGQPDFIKISSVLSFDPQAGTDNPGNPENYAITPNPDRNESGIEVRGKGRIYFRIGMTSKNSSGAPRYGVIEIRHHQGNEGSTPWVETTYCYIRQGEEADYIYRREDVITEGVLMGQLREAARQFSPYNLTSLALKNGSETASSVLYKNGAVFVDYPTQAGAFFVWGTSDLSMVRKAYHPTKKVDENDWPASIDAGSGFWDNKYKSDNDVSPAGYSRPSDGYEAQKAFNGNYVGELGSPDPTKDYSSEIENSHFRVSLFLVPEAGNGFHETDVKATYPGSNPNEKGVAEKLPGTKGGIYADGFFDRRPITNDAVSTTNANIAYAGLLFFNEKTKASLFFPGAGRRTNGTRELEFQGTGYYWSSSIGPWYDKAHHPAWRMAFSYYSIGPSSELSNFGHSIRCIKTKN